MGANTSNNVRCIAVGYSHSLALRNDGSIVACKNNNIGQFDIPSANTGFIAKTMDGFLLAYVKRKMNKGY